MSRKESVKQFDTFRAISSSPDGLTIAKLCRILKATSNAVKGHIKRLRASGRIERIAYGVWKTVPEKVSNKHYHQSPNGQGIEVPEYTFSLHDCVAVLEVPESERSALWLAVQVQRLVLGTMPIRRLRGLRFTFRGVRCVLWPARLVLYVSRAHLGSDFDTLRAEVLKDAGVLIRGLGALCRVSLRHPEGHRLWLSRRWHYAKKGDPWARDLRQRSEKLRVPLSRGLLVVDFSEHVDDFEAQSTPPHYMDNSLVPFLRGLEKIPGFTPQEMMKLFAAAALRDEQQARLIRDIVQRLGWSE